MASPAKACLRALSDATARWPNRSKASDGIMGDASHQARKSDHNDGNAFDVTHDPDNGCDGETIAALAQQDRRTKYVIWNKQIWSVARQSEGWRPYDGANPHTHHCHVSIIEALRDDDSAWPWAPERSEDVKSSAELSQLKSDGTSIAIGLAAAFSLYGIIRSLKGW